MKINKDYFLREVSGSFIAVPAGELVRQDPNILDMNASAAFLFKLLQTGCEKDELVAALQKEYELDEQKAAADVEAFLDLLKEQKLL